MAASPPFLFWKTLVPGRDKRFNVKGTELSGAILPNPRFAVYEVRSLESDGMPSVFFRVRDAETVTDAEIRDGIRPRVCREATTLEAALDGLEWDNCHEW